MKNYVLLSLSLLAASSIYAMETAKVDETSLQPIQPITSELSHNELAQEAVANALQAYLDLRAHKSELSFLNKQPNALSLYQHRAAERTTQEISNRIYSLLYVLGNAVNKSHHLTIDAEQLKQFYREIKTLNMVVKSLKKCPANSHKAVFTNHALSCYYQLCIILENEEFKLQVLHDEKILELISKHMKKDFLKHKDANLRFSVEDVASSSPTINV